VSPNRRFFSSSPWPPRREDLPPAPWETGQPVVVPLDLVPMWVARHGVEVVDLKVRYERGRLVIVGVARPREPREEGREAAR